LFKSATEKTSSRRPLRVFIASSAISHLPKGGSDAGMTPPELMLSAIGCCAMYYAIEYLRARHLAEDGVEMRVVATKGDRPARLVEIGIEVDAPRLDARSQEGIIKAVKACLLHRTLLDPPKLKVEMAGLAAQVIVSEPPS
jgi:putative redox protein